MKTFYEFIIIFWLTFRQMNEIMISNIYYSYQARNGLYMNQNDTRVVCAIAFVRVSV